MPPIFTDLISTPASTRRQTSVGLVNSNITRSPAYFGLFHTRMAFATSTTCAVTPGGATWVSKVLRTWSAATSSLTTIMRLTSVSLVQRVATWPWIRRSSIRARPIFIWSLGPSGACGAAGLAAGELCGAAGLTLSSAGFFSAFTPSRPVSNARATNSSKLGLSSRAMKVSTSMGMLTPVTTS